MGLRPLGNIAMKMRKKAGLERTAKGCGWDYSRKPEIAISLFNLVKGNLDWGAQSSPSIHSLVPTVTITVLQ
jgi:hypothetical protein